MNEWRRRRRERETRRNLAPDKETNRGEKWNAREGENASNFFVRRRPSSYLVDGREIRLKTSSSSGREEKRRISMPSDLPARLHRRQVQRGRGLRGEKGVKIDSFPPGKPALAARESVWSSRGRDINQRLTRRAVFEVDAVHGDEGSRQAVLVPREVHGDGERVQVAANLDRNAHPPKEHIRVLTAFSPTSDPPRRTGRASP